MRNYILLLLLFFLSSFSETKEVKFYIVSQPGIITGSRGEVKYICGTKHDKEEIRSRYEILLKPGSYCYYNFNRLDTIPFVIDKSGAYKLGFQEDHPSFLIFKNDPFVESTFSKLPYFRPGSLRIGKKYKKYKNA